MFERLVAQCAGRSYGIAVSSGTAGLHLAMLALGIGPGDEVITPAFSFVASANCVEYVGARPVFADCDPRTLNMRLSDVEQKITSRTKAIIGVEVFGNPAGIDTVFEIARSRALKCVEDSCEALGSAVNGRPCGTLGDISTFAFYPNKQMTTASLPDTSG